LRVAHAHDYEDEHEDEHEDAGWGLDLPALGSPHGRRAHGVRDQRGVFRALMRAEARHREGQHLANVALGAR
jgi:hypothetical protein